MSEKEKDNTPEVSAKLIKLFASARLTLVLIAVIAGLSFLGTTGRWGFQDVYHTRYFTFLLGLLFINLLVCTLDRLPAAIRKIKMDGGEKTPPPPREPDFIIRVSGQGPEEVLKKAEKIAFGKAGVTRREMDAPGGKKDGPDAGRKMMRVSFHSSGRFAILGPHLTHAGILLIILGGIIGAIGTFKGYMQLMPGQESSIAHSMNKEGAENIRDLGFTIRCNDFKVTWYDKSPMASDYLCDLSVLVAGKQAARKIIEVNNPLHYNGYGIYQASYGPLIHLIATSTKDGSTVGHDTIMWEPWTLPGADAAYMAVEYEEHAMGMGKDMGASVTMRKHVNGELVNQFKIFERYPGFDGARKDDQVLSFRMIPGRYHTGLQIIRDPGLPVVYTGFVFLIGGVMLSFFVFHRRVWLTAREAGQNTEVLLSGRTAKAKGMFANQLKNTAEKLRDGLEGGLIAKE